MARGLVRHAFEVGARSAGGGDRGGFAGRGSSRPQAVVLPCCGGDPGRRCPTFFRLGRLRGDFSRGRSIGGLWGPCAAPAEVFHPADLFAATCGRDEPRPANPSAGCSALFAGGWFCEVSWGRRSMRCRDFRARDVSSRRLGGPRSSMAIELTSAWISAVGDVDFCGTLGVAKDTRAGFTGITLTVTIYPDPRQAPKTPPAHRSLLRRPDHRHIRPNQDCPHQLNTPQRTKDRRRLREAGLSRAHVAALRRQVAGPPQAPRRGPTNLRSKDRA